MKKVCIVFAIVLIASFISLIANARVYNSFDRINYCPYCGEPYDEDDCKPYPDYYSYKCHECGSEKVVRLKDLTDPVRSNNKNQNEDMAK